MTRMAAPRMVNRATLMESPKISIAAEETSARTERGSPRLNASARLWNSISSPNVANICICGSSSSRWMTSLWMIMPTMNPSGRAMSTVVTYG